MRDILDSMAEAVKNHDEAKAFSPADHDDFMKYLDWADTEEKLFSRLTYWMTFRGLPADQNEKYEMVRERASELKLWNGLELKLERWKEASTAEYKKIGAEEFSVLIGQDYAAYQSESVPQETQLPAPDCLKDAKPESVKWLVPDLIPLGEITLLGADGGTGKGFWTAQLIAYVTTGRTSGFFPVPPEQTGRVLVLSGEDSPSKVLVPRYRAAGADMSKVYVLTSDKYYVETGKILCLKDKALSDFVDTIEPILLVVDPLQSFIPDNVEMSARNQMRRVMTPLQAINIKHLSASLIPMHTNKKQGISGRARLADSSDIWDISRSVLMMGYSKNDDKIYISHEKSNYSKKQKTVLFHIEDAVVDGVKTAKAVFDGYSDKKDMDFIEERRFKIAQTKDDTAAAILNVLAESKLGSMESSQLKAAVMKEIGCSEPTYKRAYSELVKSGDVAKRTIRQQDGKNKWYSFLYCGETGDTVQE